MKRLPSKTTSAGALLHIMRPPFDIMNGMANVPQLSQSLLSNGAAKGWRASPRGQEPPTIFRCGAVLCVSYGVSVPEAAPTKQSERDEDWKSPVHGVVV